MKQKLAPKLIQDRLSIYKELLLKWAPRLNLVSKATLSEIDSRHFVDSSQLLPFLRLGERIIDVGSGAGFPGAVLAIYGHDVTLLDSDQKKCVFLENVSRETKTSFSVVCSRIENYTPDTHFDVITSRGVAPMEKLIQLTQHLGKKNKTRALFLKGEDYKKELLKIDPNRLTNITPSSTKNSGVILEYAY